MHQSDVQYKTPIIISVKSCKNMQKLGIKMKMKIY